MTKNIKMVAFDLDGTLLTTKKVFTERAKDAITRAAARGVVMLPATGRPLTAIPEEILYFPGIRYAITANGGRVMDTARNKVIFEELVPPEIARKVLDIYEHYDTLREVYYDGAGFAEEKMLGRIKDFFGISAMADYILSTRTPVADIRRKFESEGRAVDKVQAVFANLADKAKALDELKAVAGIEVTGALVNNIEVSVKGVNKGNALLQLGEMLHIKREEILALGDGANDIEMLKKAGCGVAMENSSVEVKSAADFVTVSNDEDGVARVIEEYVL
ncbi:Cof-type HAD-IIB family hydrolase [Extibacter muris]|uniref:Cof-type HAD-IIB family hydrolase n=1 Tax=Extibacter muris TaxID=1796622 RepID=UPI001D095E90|nr:Cof-type HAD-IIB family hydrolase [Extibacter muris]MCB6202355.1 Cof-type HAD-IIB family hydrolase [Extibacter muris]MCQ4665285.1 Cof-type HAD-IIB family hydrolase [Extibacter muris]MCQ4694654.1 Cof-type HAD-IIB family hydrolase [Extibacter muris]